MKCVVDEHELRLLQQALQYFLDSTFDATRNHDILNDKLIRLGYGKAESNIGKGVKE